MAVIEIAKIQIRRGQENQTGIPRLDPGEFAWAEDTENLYIGKRVAEGANTDENTRILTDRDLNFFKLAIQNTGTVNSAYTYRQGDAYIGAVPTTVQTKLDETVSLTDFGVVTSSTAVDITVAFNRAIEKIFYNQTFEDWQRVNARRNLVVPAGNYYISDTVSLPPYTSLVGEGAELTTITMINPKPLFDTMDSKSKKYNDGVLMAVSGADRSKNISIKNMTLAYASTVTSTNALLSLDNVQNALIENVKFYANGENTGTGISIRGIVDLANSNIDNCADIHIVDCIFDNLRQGVMATGTVVRPTITESVFSKLQNAITMKSTLSPLYRGPIAGKFTNNKFENIAKEAIYVGTASHVTNHISEGNFFRHVGNGTTAFNDQNVTEFSTSATSVITFLTSGNSSVNDTFYRKTYADSITSSEPFYYNPLVTGNATIDSSAISTATIAVYGNTDIVKIPLTGKDQSLTVRYSLHDARYSRKGKLTINISPDGFGSISDYYDYSFEPTWNNGDPIFSINNDSTYTDNGFVILQCNGGGHEYGYEAQVDILITNN